MSQTDRGRPLMILVHAIGLAAFVWPLLAPGVGITQQSREMPILVALLAAAVVGTALKRKWTAGEIALLGILAGVNAVLRIPGSFGGASLMFVLPILAGRVFGARFAFTLGATSMAASALVTGGLGPWLPFQMWALGWVGAAAAYVPRRWGVMGLAVYAWAAGFAFGALMNLWFWPFQGGASQLSFQAGASIKENLASYWRFYLVTSLAWDATRAFGNLLLIGFAGKPFLTILEETRGRLTGSWVGSESWPTKSPPSPIQLPQTENLPLVKTS